MRRNCGTCFHSGTAPDRCPCNTCVKSDGTHLNWVAKDFLANVSDTPVTPAVAADGDIVIPFKAGVKYDQDKPQWTLVPFKALDEVVKVLTIGARKYAPDNWKKVPNARQRYIDAAFRHMSAYASGEKLDAETGKSHLAHAVCCLLLLLAFDIEEP